MIIALWLAVSARAAELDESAAARFADLALACVHKEYPNQIKHVMNTDADAKPPRELTPAFYGCFDWHSAVHGHWLLARLTRTFPKADFASKARAALAEDLTQEHITTELAYLEAPGRVLFERPYGLAWLLQLDAELREWDDPDARKWSATLDPLAKAAAARIADWLPKLSHPIRIGEHDQSAFAMGLTLDWARLTKNAEVEKVVLERAKDFYGKDRDCPMAYEPSGHDFLSPCLSEADLMRRVLPSGEFGTWLEAFLPGLPKDGSAWLEPAVVTDPMDPKIGHLAGLNLSRAWMLEGIASTLPGSDKRLASIERAARAHRESGLASVTGAHYVQGAHWLGSYATYLTTERGLTKR